MNFAKAKIVVLDVTEVQTEEVGEVDDKKEVYHSQGYSVVFYQDDPLEDEVAPYKDDDELQVDAQTLMAVVAEVVFVSDQLILHL